MNNGESIKQKILQSKGYWRVIVRPSISSYKERRFDISNLKSIIEKNRVILRGWDYPHFKFDTVEISDQNKIRNYCDFDGEIEFWEFTTSGQFAHIFAMYEDFIIDEKKSEEIRSRFRFNKDEVTTINKFLDITSTLYRFTEIFNFSSNLAQLKENDNVGEFEILVELHGVKNRMLFNWDPLRSLFTPYICKIDKDEIVFHESYDKNDLIVNFDIYALEKSIETFKLFNWENPPHQVLKEDQKKLLERRL